MSGLYYIVMYVLGNKSPVHFDVHYFRGFCGGSENPI